MKFKDNTLPGILRSLLADEYLAYIQYFMASVIAKGKALNFADKIFSETREDELKDHYQKLTNIAQSLGIPVPTGLEEMQSIANTPYIEFKDPTGTDVLVDNQIVAEEEAIEAYTQAMNEPVFDEYPDVKVALGEICTDEREHLKELEDVKSSIEHPITNFAKKYDPKTSLSNLRKAIKQDTESNANFMSSTQFIMDHLATIDSIKWEPVGRAVLRDGEQIEYSGKKQSIDKILELYICKDYEKVDATSINGKDTDFVESIYYYNNDILVHLEIYPLAETIVSVFKIKTAEVPSELIDTLSKSSNWTEAKLKNFSERNFSERLNNIKKLFSSKDPSTTETYIVVYKDEDGQEEYKGTYDECQKFITACEGRVSSGEKFELISGPDPVK